MMNGSLPLDKFIYYLKQDYVYLIEFGRCIGLAATKVDDVKMMRSFVSIMDAGLTVELEMLENLANKLDIPIRQLKDAVLAPSNYAYTRHLLCIAYSGTVGEIMASMLPCIWTYKEIGKRICGEDDLRSHSIYHEWCAAYRSQEYIDLVEWYRQITNRYSESGDLIREKMRRHFILSSRYEYMFWDMAYRKESWPV